MPSAYLAAAEFPVYGVRATATAAHVTQASMLIDGYLHRPEGMVWAPDSSGVPCHMAAAEPSLSLALAQASAPGANVTLSVAPAIALPADFIGEVLVLERGVAGQTESAVITALPAPGQVTVDRLVNAHPQAAPVEAGLLIGEELQLPKGRSIARCSRPNPVRVAALQGRLSYGRRSQQMEGFYDDLSLLSALSALGGAPSWLPVDVRNVSVSPVTGELWVPASIYLATFSECRVRYVAGFSQPPAPLKQATALLVNQVVDSNGLSDAFRDATAGDHRLVRFAGMLFDQAVRQLLEPYRASILL